MEKKRKGKASEGNDMIHGTQIDIKDITNHLNSISSEIFQNISDKVNGRIPHKHILLLHTLRELMADKCQTYLEIGVHNGGSMAVAMQSKHPCIFYGVDMFQEVIKIPRWSYFARDNLSKQKTIKNIQSCNINNYQFHIFEGNSREVSTLNKVYEQIKSVDLLFIDGDHSYQGVKDDFLNYGKLVRPGGFVVLDDYANGHPEIVKFVEEIPDVWHRIGSTTNEYIVQKV